MWSQGREFGRGGTSYPSTPVELFGRGVLERWVQLPDQGSGVIEPPVDTARQGWWLVQSLRGTVMPLSPDAARRSGEDGIPRINFLVDEGQQWTDDDMDNIHPRLVELGCQKTGTTDGIAVLTEWVLGAMHDDGADASQASIKA